MNNTLEVIAATTFGPAPQTAYMRNCYGATIAGVLPVRVGAGEYYVTIPAGCGIDHTTPAGLKKSAISINARAYKAGGASRNVTVAASLNGGDGSTNVAIYVRDDANAKSDDFDLCEVSISRLPLV